MTMHDFNYTIIHIYIHSQNTDNQLKAYGYNIWEGTLETRKTKKMKFLSRTNLRRDAIAVLTNRNHIATVMASQCE